MAEVQLATDNERQIWVRDYLQEYVRKSRFGAVRAVVDPNRTSASVGRLPNSNHAR